MLLKMTYARKGRVRTTSKILTLLNKEVVLELPLTTHYEKRSR